MYGRLMNIVTERARAAVKKHGGLRKAARALGVNYSTLSLLQNGKRPSASERTLQALGLTRKIRDA
jgi:DNA-binding Xre family transcriptional regulator